MIKITKRAVDALEPTPGADRFLWDNEVRGFGVRLKPSGVATYIIQYRTEDLRRAFGARAARQADGRAGAGPGKAEACGGFDG